MRGAGSAAALAALILSGGWLLGGWLFGGWGLAALAAARYDPADEWQGLPAGEGREEVFYTCVACHSMATVMQQRLSRRWWEITTDRMIDDMGMIEPEPAERDLILDYLEEHFGQDSRR